MKVVSYGLTNIKSSADQTRLSLYFGKYMYRLTARITNVHFFRYVRTLKSFQERLDYEVSPYTDLYTRTSKFTFIPLKDLIEQGCPGSTSTIQELVQWRENNRVSTNNYSFRIYRNELDFYTSNTALLEDLYQNLNKHGTQLRVNHVDLLPDWDKNSVYHKNPKNKLRVYLNFFKLDGKEVKEFSNFVESHGLNLCPSLKRSISNCLRRLGKGTIAITPYGDTVFVHNTHFFDIDDDYVITITALKYPVLIRKVATIKQR